MKTEITNEGLETMDNVNVELDLSKLSVKDLADLLAKARQAEKAAKAEKSTLPMFAYVMVMTDSTLVYWSGRAVDHMAAMDAAQVYAQQDGKEVFVDALGNVSIAPRPVPAPRGRKAKTEAS